jgi:hypothetical protein
MLILLSPSNDKKEKKYKILQNLITFSKHFRSREERFKKKALSEKLMLLEEIL